MVTDMNENKIRSWEEVRTCLAGTMEVAFSIPDKDARYRWVEQTLRRFHDRTLGRSDRSLVLRYIERVNGYSRQTVTRLVAQYRDNGKLVRHQRTAADFTRYHTDADGRLCFSQTRHHLRAVGCNRHARSDNEAAKPMNEAKRQHFNTRFEQRGEVAGRATPSTTEHVE